MTGGGPRSIAPCYYPPPMRSILLACLFALFWTASCLLELDTEIACGDGYADSVSGEECDPGDPESFRFGCPGGGPGSCDPTTCQLQCCGDNQINGNEECDGPEFDLAAPDKTATNDDTCRGLTVPGTDVHYTTGDASCTAECRIDRSECSLCGNGQVDTQILYSDGSVLAAEVCDGSLFDLDELSRVCAPACDLPSSTQIACNVDCSGCRLLTVRDPTGCCFPKDAPRVDDRYPCCCTLDPRGCAFEITPGDVTPTCAGLAPAEAGE